MPTNFALLTVVVAFAAVATPAGAAEPRVAVVEAAKERNHLVLPRARARPPEASTTALHWAAPSNHEELSRLLARARRRPANRYGVTPMPLAAEPATPRSSRRC